LGNADETAAWRDLEAAAGAALWRYAETVNRVRRDKAGQGPAQHRQRRRARRRRHPKGDVSRSCQYLASTSAGFI
jgi:hypothetical protein